MYILFQVFEAIATEYEIKDTVKRPTESASARASPSRSPNISPALNRKGYYQISMMNKNKKTVQFHDKFGHNSASDPNIHRSTNTQDYVRRLPTISSNSTISAENMQTGNTSCNCQNSKTKVLENIPKIKIEDTEANKCCQNAIQHKLVARLRQACSLADLQNSGHNCLCSTSKSWNNICFDQWLV